MYSDQNIYIDLRWDEMVDDPMGYLSKLFRMVEVGYQYKANVYYSTEQLADFLTSCQELYENRVASKANALQMILKNAIPVERKEFIFRVQFGNQASYLEHIVDDLLCFIQRDKNIVVISTRLQEGEQEPFLLVRSHTDFDKVCIYAVRSPEGIVTTLNSTGPKRNFFLSPKHGENGRGNWHGESALNCDRATAQEYLNRAIPDFREKLRLFYHDAPLGTFVEFYYQGDNPQVEWHGFHMAANKVSERVPNSVQKYYGFVG